MNNPNIKLYKYSISAVILPILVGLIFIIVGAFILKSSIVDPSWKKVDGIVVDTEFKDGGADDSDMYTAIVEYEVDGKTYQAKGGISSSIKPAINSIKEISYNPNNPAEAKVDAGSVLIFIAIFPIVGLAVVAISVITIIKHQKRTRRIVELQRTGNKITGLIKSVNLAMTVNRVGLFKIEVIANNNSGQTQNYTSDLIVGADSLAFVDFYQNKTPINVFVNPIDAKDYYVDINNLSSINTMNATDPTKINNFNV